MSTLITLGCSFSVGQGCYGDLDISKIDKETYPTYSHSDDFISGSIGRNLQNHLCKKQSFHRESFEFSEHSSYETTI